MDESIPFLSKDDCRLDVTELANVGHNEPSIGEMLGEHSGHALQEVDSLPDEPVLPKVAEEGDDEGLFLTTHLGMSLRVSGELPFTLSRPTFKPREVGGKVSVVEDRESRIHEIPMTHNHAGERFMTPALGTLIEYVALTQHNLRVNFSFDELTVPAFPRDAGEDPEGLPSSTVETLRNTKMGLVEVFGRRSLIDFIQRFARTSRQGLVVLAASNTDVNKLEADLRCPNGTSVRVFNTAKPMDMDTINDYAAIRRKPIPNIIVGTPQSIVGNDLSWEYYVGNIIAIDERVLIANNRSFSYAIDDCRFPKRLLLCLPPRVTLDRKWDLPIFEYAGPFRYFHVGKGILSKPPVRQELKLKWSINGPSKVESDLEIAVLIDGHKSRFRAIEKLFDNSKLKDLPRTALVFPTHSSVKGFLAISPRFKPLNGHSAINSADPIVCTTQELIETETADIDTIVWAGAREYAFDFHRRLLCKRASKSPLQLFDLTDSPGGHPKLATQIGNTLRRWAKRRRSQYRALGYHGSIDEMAEYNKVYERIARVMYQPL